MVENDNLALVFSPEPTCLFKVLFFIHFRYERRKSQMIVSIEDEAAEAAEVANLMARRNSQVHIVSFL